MATFYTQGIFLGLVLSKVIVGGETDLAFVLNTTLVGNLEVTLT